MRVTLEMNKEQAETLTKALELFARIGMGQLHDLTWHPAFQERDFELDKVDQVIDQLKETVFTDLHGRGHSYGIRNEQTHETSREAYDLYQVVRHALARHQNPEGKSWNVHFDEPTQFSEQPLSKCRVED